MALKESDEPRAHIKLPVFCCGVPWIAAAHKMARHHIRSSMLIKTVSQNDPLFFVTHATGIVLSENGQRFMCFMGLWDLPPKEPKEEEEHVRWVV